MKTRFKMMIGVILFLLLVLTVIGSVGYSGKKSSLSGQKVTLFKSSECGCCRVYAQYLKGRGLDVEIVNMEDRSTIKSQYNIPSAMGSCHTAIIGDYIVEGHIPVEAMEKLMDEKPEIKGIAMPGMPSGSPGMPGAKDGPFVIYAINVDGSAKEFMKI